MEIKASLKKTVEIYDVEIGGKQFEFTCESKWEGMIKLKNNEMGVIIASVNENVFDEIFSDISRPKSDSKDMTIIKASPSILSALS